MPCPDRPVAVKTIIEANEGQEARSRLWREARSLARVNHPNVCQVFDVLEEGESGISHAGHLEPLSVTRVTDFSIPDQYRG